MVDINLIGDDQSQFEGEENEKEFQESYESDLNEPAPSSYVGSGHIDDSDYSRVLSRGGSKKIVYILAACSIILLAVVAWFIFQPGKGKKTTYEPPVTTFSEPETTTYEDTSGALNFETEANVIPTSPLSPALRERIVKSYRGINTVSNILNAIPSNINFTMISYSDGKFLLEFLSAGDADINHVNSQLQQTLYSANVNLLSKDNRNIQSRQFRQALVNGNVDINQSPGELNNPQEPIYLSSADLQNQLASICQQAGLTIKQFDAGLEKADGQFMILPIKFKATGQKSHISAFLQQLINANINISFSKISLIANEADLSDPKITLLLNIGLYRMI
jgi:hypothetical protein